MTGLGSRSVGSDRALADGMNGRISKIKAELAACNDLREEYPKQINRSAVQIAVNAGFAPVHLGRGEIAFQKREKTEIWSITSGDGAVSARPGDDAWTIRRTADGKEGIPATTSVEEGVPLESLLSIRRRLPIPTVSAGIGYETSYATWHDVLWKQASGSQDDFEKILGKTLFKQAFAAGFEIGEDRDRMYLVKFDDFDTDTWWEISAGDDISAHPDTRSWSVARVCCAQGGEMFRSHVREKTTLSTAIDNIAFVPDAFERRSVARWSAAKEIPQFRPGYPR